MHLDGVNIGVDVDGVLAANHPTICREIRNRTGVDFYPSDITKWDPIIPGLGVTLGEAMRWVSNDAVTRRMSPIDGASEGMQALRESGATTTIVTHRAPDRFSATKEWLSDRGIPYDEFADDMDSSTPKSTVDVDILIDDRPKNVIDMAEAGRDAILMLRKSNLKTLPDTENDNIHIAGTGTYEKHTLAEHQELQWECVPRLVESLTR